MFTPADAGLTFNQYFVWLALPSTNSGIVFFISFVLGPKSSGN